jgi:[ribosomal protein S5]-alanine N-acetyltransferase
MVTGMIAPAEFTTFRLHLRMHSLGDAPAIFLAYAQDMEVTRYLIWRAHPDVETTRAFLQRCVDVWNRQEAFPWVIIHKADQRLIGMIELQITDHHAELGYVLARPYWGQGLMTEAVRVVVQWAMSQPRLSRVEALCDLDNHASARVLEKAGFKKEELLPRRLVHPNLSNEPRDCWRYAMTK